jgi:hypothetical protein
VGFARDEDGYVFIALTPGRKGALGANFGAALPPLLAMWVLALCWCAPNISNKSPTCFAFDLKMTIF